MWYVELSTVAKIHGQKLDGYNNLDQFTWWLRQLQQDRKKWQVSPGWETGQSMNEHFWVNPYRAETEAIIIIITIILRTDTESKKALGVNSPKLHWTTRAYLDIVPVQCPQHLCDGQLDGVLWGHRRDEIWVHGVTQEHCASGGHSDLWDAHRGQHRGHGHGSVFSRHVQHSHNVGGGDDASPCVCVQPVAS